MKILLKFSRLIDTLNEKCGRVFMTLVLVAVLISAGNAIMRKVFHHSSNAFLEVQWYLFGAIFLMCAGYALKHNSHVRLDVIIGRVSKRAHAWIDVFGSLFFLLPLCALVLYYSWPQFMKAWISLEMSPDAGGLIRWPALLLIPVGFALLTLQGIAELIKNIAFLKGVAPFPYEEKDNTGGDELLEDVQGLVKDITSRKKETSRRKDKQ